MLEHYTMQIPSEEVKSDVKVTKIIKVGGSGAIIIPASLLRSKHLKPGDFVRISLLGLGSAITHMKVIVEEDEKKE